MRVLVVEDERRLARYIKKGLEEHHFAVDLAADGKEGLCCAQVNEYDVIVLDLLLPKKDGLTVLRELRERDDQVPVLILTARDALTDKVAGFDAGADDYLTKPFSFVELLLRRWETWLWTLPLTARAGRENLCNSPAKSLRYSNSFCVIRAES